MDGITKLLIVLAIIIAILVFAGIGYLVIDSDRQDINDNYNEIIEDSNTIDENEIDEEEIDEEEQVEENTVVEEVSEDPEANKRGVQQQVTGREEQQTGIQANQKTDDQKVIEMAKKKWGENDNNVSFNIVNREGHIFKVSVNNKSTTAVLAWYTVNLSTGEVTQ